MMTHALAAADRSVLSVSGPEARDFLQGILTQDMARVAEDRAAWSALLTPQGKLLFDFFLIAAPSGTGERFIIDVASDQAEALMKRLSLYKLRAQVTIEAEPDLGVLLAFGGEPSAPEGYVVKSLPGGVLFVDPRLAELGLRGVVRRAERDAALSELGEAAPFSAYEAHRVALCVPASPTDIVPGDTFPLDANMDALHGVDYRKGCFIGQEVASRMKRKGEVRKRMLIARFDGDAPETGAAVTAGEASLGDIRSVGNGTAIALIRVDKLKTAIAEGRAPLTGGRPVVLGEPEYLLDAAR